MPRILYLTDQAVIILCEYVPNMKKKDEEAKLMRETEEKFCAPLCGYYRDAAQKGPDFRLTCINPNNPVLPKLKEKLGIA